MAAPSSGIDSAVPHPHLPPPSCVPSGNDFSTLYAPLIRDGRMEKYYWNPTREDRIGVCMGIFQEDKVHRGEVEVLVDAFPGQSIDFFGALRSRVYDDKVRRRGLRRSVSLNNEMLLYSFRLLADPSGSFSYPPSSQVRAFVKELGVENMGKRLINSKEGNVHFEKPAMNLDILMKYGQSVVMEQENVKRVQLAEEYLSGAALAGNSGSSLPEGFAAK